MNCPEHKESMSQMGQPHYEANGDVFTYYWCNSCRCDWEVVEDAIFGGEPSIERCD